GRSDLRAWFWRRRYLVVTFVVLSIHRENVDSLPKAHHRGAVCRPKEGEILRFHHRRRWSRQPNHAYMPSRQLGQLLWQKPGHATLSHACPFPPRCPAKVL